MSGVGGSNGFCGHACMHARALGLTLGGNNGQQQRRWRCRNRSKWRLTVTEGWPGGGVPVLASRCLRRWEGEEAERRGEGAAVQHRAVQDACNNYLVEGLAGWLLARSRVRWRQLIIYSTKGMRRKELIGKQRQPDLLLVLVLATLGTYE